MTTKKPGRSSKAPSRKDDAGKQVSSGRGATFPIVGVGASAGGLEAFIQLLKALPHDTGMGFVLVQHLDPDHESQLTQILGRAISLPVREIRDGERIEPDHVYVIPPDTNLSISDGVLKIRPRPRVRAPHRPIDSFFESLAQDRREQAVGVVLSGTASDGTLGLEAIKAEGGITFAQDASAKHDSMPRSAVAAGCVDLVLSPAEIAHEIARIAKHPHVAGQPPFGPAVEGDTSAEEDRASATAHEDDKTPLPSGGKGAPDTGAKRARAEAESAGKSQAGKAAEDGYKKILLLLRNHSGVDFSLYKSTTIQRRITRRLVLSKLNTLEEYAGFLRGNAKELDALYSDVLISVTSFFRNPETFEVLQEKVLPELLKRPRDEPIRCWVLGCSTGQEAYSIAIAFSEAVEKAPRAHSLQIFATDLNDALLDKARHGLYARSLVDDISPERLRRFFVEEEGGYRVTKALREMVVFARQNVIADPPFSRMDLVSCRNLLIYLEPSLQRKALPTFHYALKPGGFLLLGASESIGGFTDLFEPVDRKQKIYSRKLAPTPLLHFPLKKEHGGTQANLRTLLPIRATDVPELSAGLRGELDAQREADRITVNQFAPPGVLVNAELQVLQFRGPTGAFLEPPVGKASFDVLKMAREGLMLPLRSAINQARKDNKTARKENVRVKQNGKSRTVNLEVIPLRNLRERSFLILFEEVGGTSVERKQAGRSRPPGPEERRRVAELETELSDMREYLQLIQEQHEAANEEVQSSNEEIQSANEELQSVNEELETSKEELESANEELTTVNDEMSNRNVELNRLNNDIINFQTSAKLAILLLGRDLSIRRFSPQAEKQFELLAADVGRPIKHIRHGLLEAEPASPHNEERGAPGSGSAQNPLDLETLVVGVIADVREQEREVLDKGGRWHALRVRPYITLDGKVDGAVLVLLDIDALKRSEQEMRESEDRYRTLFTAAPMAVFVCDRDAVIQQYNVRAVELWGREPICGVEKHCGSTKLWLPNGALLPHPQSPVVEVLRTGIPASNVEVLIERPDGSRLPVLANFAPLKNARGETTGAITAFIDITQLKEAEEKARQGMQASAHLASIVTSSDDAIVSKDLHDIIQTWNKGAERLFGYTAEEVIGKPITLLIPADRVDEEPHILERIGRGESVDHYETVRQRKDGSLLDISLTVFPVRDGDGHIIGAAKIARDITQRMQTERALRDLNLELRENEERLRQYSVELSEAATRKNEFLAMLGHELRNPLSAFGHGLELLSRMTEDGARSAGVRAMMARQTKRISTLLDQLLDIARVVSDKVELSKDHIDLGEVVRAAVETVRPLSEAQKHELTVTFPPDEHVFVLGDAIRLTQVVENLLTNAIKYTDEGGQIALSLEADDDEARIFVRDNGSGMSAELLPHVFEVFTQAPRTLDRAKGGLGLGLPLVKRLVELHGGSVSASSPGIGNGSEFIVTLPRLREVRTTDERLEGKGSETEPGRVQPRRIMVVDDERDVGDSLADLLQEDGHDVLPVKSGSAALDAVRTFAPEVVLLDLGLPEMDGYAVARKLRDDHGNQEMLLIAVTGYQNDVARLKQAGFDHHLIKPLNMRKLSALLAALDGPNAPG